VTYIDENGPLGGEAMRCQLELAGAGDPIVVSSTAARWGVALNESLRKAARALARSNERSQVHMQRREQARALRRIESAPL
jgi:hypothetical protein